MFLFCVSYPSGMNVSWIPPLTSRFRNNPSEHILQLSVTRLNAKRKHTPNVAELRTVPLPGS
eukprot:m.915661 g.915661  ORF g.915661 m.915661 type:complete len:62 (-) comp23732_c0_seq87:257-442(-)